MHKILAASGAGWRFAVQSAGDLGADRRQVLGEPLIFIIAQAAAMRILGDILPDLVQLSFELQGFFLADFAGLHPAVNAVRQ